MPNTSHLFVLLLFAFFTIVVQTFALEDLYKICLTCTYRDEPVCGKNGVSWLTLEDVSTVDALNWKIKKMIFQDSFVLFHIQTFFSSNSGKLFIRQLVFQLFPLHTFLRGAVRLSRTPASTCCCKFCHPFRTVAPTVWCKRSLHHGQVDFQ